MINNDDNQQLISNSQDAQLISKALNTNWRIKIDYKIQQKVVKYIYRREDRKPFSFPYTFSVNDLVDYYSQDILDEVDGVNRFSRLKKNKEKDFFSMVYISTLYTKWLINDFEQSLSKRRKELANKNKESDFGGVPGMKKMMLAMAIMMAAVPRPKAEVIKDIDDIDIKEYSSTPFLSRVFKHLIQIKQSFSLFLEIFYRIMGQMELSIFDYKTYNTLNDSITEEKYEQFRDIIYDWNPEIIAVLTIIFEQLYPIFLFLEINISKEKQNTLDRIRYFLTERNFAKKILNHQPVTIETSLTSFILVTIINYLTFNFLDKYWSEDVSDCIHHTFWIKNDFIITHSGYKEWIDKNMKKQLFFFQNTATVRLFDDPQTIRDDEKDNDDESNNSTSNNQANKEQEQQQKSSIGESGRQSSRTQSQQEAPRHIEVRCSKEMLTKLAEGLVKGIDDESKPLVTSTVKERNGTIIKKLVCLFSGVGIHDESLEWPYNLKWKDYANSLKLLVYLLKYDGELKDPLDAVDENDVEGIAKEIKQDSTGIPVWSVIGPALGYSERSLSSKAKIPVKNNNVGLMKKLAQFWYECKKLDD